MTEKQSNEVISSTEFCGIASRTSSFEKCLQAFACSGLFGDFPIYMFSRLFCLIHLTSNACFLYEKRADLSINPSRLEKILFRSPIWTVVEKNSVLSIDGLTTRLCGPTFFACLRYEISCICKNQARIAHGGSRAFWQGRIPKTYSKTYLSCLNSSIASSLPVKVLWPCGRPCTCRLS